MSQEGAAERLSALRAALVERVAHLSGGGETKDEHQGASECVDECLRCLRRALVGLTDTMTLEALTAMMSSLVDTFEGLLALARKAEPPLHGQLLAGRLWQAELLKRAPWCPVSERQLMYILEELFQTLGLTASSLSLWAEVTPSCAPPLWVERGLRDALEALVDQSDETPSVTHGLMLTGEGASAGLAWAHRALLEQGFQVIAPLPACATWAVDELTRHLNEPTTTERVASEGEGLALLIDDLQDATRPFIWRVAELLSSDQRPSLIIWSGGSSGFVPALQSATKATLLHLPPWGEAEWGRWSALAGGERPASVRGERLRLSDQLRLSERAWLSAERGAVSMIALPREEPYEDIELLASVMGPTPSTRSLVEALGCPDVSAEGQLTYAGFLQRGPSRVWGMIWEHARAAQWSEALSELATRVDPMVNGGVSRARAETLRQALESLLGALQSTELHTERWFTQSVARRLSALLGEELQVTSPVSPTLEELREGRRRLSPLVSGEASPHPLTLGVVCGLALDWAGRASDEGGARETFEVLQLGVSAAERLGDPLRAGQLSLTLGRLALFEGLPELARLSLETAAQLFASLRRAPEALQALSAWAEAEVLSGQLRRAKALYGRAEGLMRQLSYDEGLWPLRFKRGQLCRQMGDAEEALALWEALELKDSGAYAEALLLERALAELTLVRHDPVALEAMVSSLSDSALKSMLLIRCEALKGSSVGLERGLELIIELNQSRALGDWFTACELWAQSILEVEEARGALEAASRMLEQAIKGAVATRDRLRLTSLYALLSLCYERRAMLEEARVARGFMEAWRAQLTGQVEGLPSLKLCLQASQTQVDEALMSQVNEEVSAELLRWRSPISLLTQRGADET